MALNYALILLPLLLVGSIPTAEASRDYSLQTLNHTLHGRLRPTEPFAKPCFSHFEGKHVGENQTLCAERIQHYTSSSYRAQFPGAYMYEQSSICANQPPASDGCLLDPNRLNESITGVDRDCRLGNLPSYYVDVQKPSDVTAAFRYARETGDKLVIKNSGHSYVEDSTGRGTLALWTQNLKSMSYSSSFKPSGCPDLFHPHGKMAITTGAGVSCGEAYEFADQKNVTLVCGYSPTVGITGGWVQGAGHSVLSNLYGLGVDRVLQFTIVTPDGQTRVANECQNSDLFWALRGGGGGTFGVVLDATHLVEPVISVVAAGISVPKANSSAVSGFMDALVDTAIDLADDGWGGHIYGDALQYVNPKLSLKEAKQSLGPILQYAEGAGGQTELTWYKSFFDFFNKTVVQANTEVPVGDFTFSNCRLVPKSIFTEKSLRNNLKAFLHRQIEAGDLPYIPVDSPWLYRGKPWSTSVTPAWYSSPWELTFGSYWQWNATVDERKEVVQRLVNQTAELELLTPGGGAYRNEANPWTKNWQDAWWGYNYPELLKIKKRYDPHNLLQCWRCVGWTEEDARESCYAGLDL